MSDPVSAAVAELYADDPAGFLARRTELARAAKASGDPDAAAAIAALRKPTAAAALVNRSVWADETVASRIVELGDRLRAAHERLDAALLRDLTTERRSLVSALTRSAAARASAAVRDEVTATFDAAIADPSVAARLGQLTKGESWSGFGVAPAGPPTLTVVRGGRTDAAPRAAPAERAAPTVPPAQRRKLARALERAQTAFDAAEAELTSADSAERAVVERVRELTAELAERQKALEVAKRDQDAARKAARAARSRRREARSALDRAERNSSRADS